MSTRSRIGIELKSGKVLSIYCHFDGYLDGVGETLKKFYSKRSIVEQLIALGDISSLGKVIGSKHNFDSPPKNECNVYARDREEEGTEAFEQSKTEFQEAEEFAYLFTLQDTWIYSDHGNEFKPLK